MSYNSRKTPPLNAGVEWTVLQSFPWNCSQVNQIMGPAPIIFYNKLYEPITPIGRCTCVLFLNPLHLQLSLWNGEIVSEDG